MKIDPNLPIDKIAALVVSKPKELTRDFRHSHMVSSLSPLPITSFLGPKEHDLTGRKCGRLTVIGNALFKPKNWRTDKNSVRWVVRCSCGRYEHRTTKTIKKADPISCCNQCKL
jgi:hypothetical protein